MRFCKWLLLLVLAIARPGWAQGDRCADCHIANPQADPVPEHTYDWETSAHGRSVVGCEKCHDGDATTFESVLAHRGILTSRNPASPTHRTNLPQTCGKCHLGPFVEFQKSRHYQLLRESSGGAYLLHLPRCGRRASSLASLSGEKVRHLPWSRRCPSELGLRARWSHSSGASSFGARDLGDGAAAHRPGEGSG